MKGCWRLDCAEQTLVLASDGGLAQVVHWGARLAEDEDLVALAEAAEADLTGGMLDSNAPLSLCPEAAHGFAGQPGLAVAETDGTPLNLPPFVLVDVNRDADGLCLRAEAAGVTLTHTITALPGSGQFRLESRLEADRDLRLSWLAAPVLPAPQSGTIIEPAGRWIGEFRLQHHPWGPGARLREARQGRSGHEHPPYVILAEEGTTNTAGRACALQYGWSGGHRMVAEELPDGRRQIQFGHVPGSEPRPARRFETAPLYAVWTAGGLNGVAAANQRLVRGLVHFPDPARPRPVHYNCWEAVYFDHEPAALARLAERAAAVGAERFVLDDGWFGRRDDDRSSLGDWVVDRRKWPDGLGPLIDRVEALGMRFGLWVEPEMVSPDSDLFRGHPDWILGPTDQPMGRHQLVLDLGREAVREHLFACLSDLLGSHRIDYLKWDHNRLLPVAGAEEQTRGLYALVDRLRAAHPEVEIESCASGGGRIDAGILERMHRVWLSDSNDALERLRIQHEAALFLPPEVTGAHVGPRRCHTSGRVLDIGFRALVAAQRHLGFEMDLNELDAEEESRLRAVTDWWKAGRHWRMKARVARLDPADPAVTAEIQIAEDGSRFTLFAGQTRSSAQILPRPLRLCGLDPEARYRMELVNAGDRTERSRRGVALSRGALTLTGQALMERGLTLPWTPPAAIWVIDGERL